MRDIEVLGRALDGEGAIPELSAGRIEWERSEVDEATALARLCGEGWVTFTGHVASFSGRPAAVDGQRLLSGESFDRGSATSVSVRHHLAGRYVLRTFRATSGDGLLSRRSFLRADRGGHAIYETFWDVEAAGPRKGTRVPRATRFLGFRTGN